MSYIEKEPIIEFITKGLNNPDKTKAFGHDAIEILTEIEYTPTADVVPKSEYDAVVSAVDNSTKEFLKLHDTHQEQKLKIWRLQGEVEKLHEIINGFEEQSAKEFQDFMRLSEKCEKSKADVVKEIFAEIETALNLYKCHGDSGIYYEHYLEADIAELKKKYTEGDQ